MHGGRRGGPGGPGLPDARGAESLPETWFESRVRAPHGIPLLERQAQQPDRTRTDLKNAEFRINVEIDGRLWHAGHRFHLDRRRDRRAAGRGELTLRTTPLELDQTPCEVAGDLAHALRQPPGPQASGPVTCSAAARTRPSRTRSTTVSISGER